MRFSLCRWLSQFLNYLSDTHGRAHSQKRKWQIHAYSINMLFVSPNNRNHQIAQNGNQKKRFTEKQATYKLGIYTPTLRLTKYTSGSAAFPQLDWAVAEFHHHLTRVKSLFREISALIIEVWTESSHSSLAPEPAALVLTKRTCSSNSKLNAVP